MIKVTNRAKKELKRISETRPVEQGNCLRLTTPPIWSGEGDFGVVVDHESGSDHVVSFQGLKILLLDADLVERLPTAVLDFKESEGGSRFTLDVF